MATGTREIGTASRARPDVARWATWIAVGAVALLGLGFRLWALGRAPINADEAVVGLMAREILHGHFFAFYWGQAYGGGEPYVVALLFALFGQSSYTLGVAPVLLDGIAALLLWRIGTRLFNRGVGIVAGLAFWVWPEFLIWQSTVEYGFRLLGLDCALGAFCVALRIADGPPATRRRARFDWVLLGLLTGVGWWATPEVAYYLIPAGGLLLVRALRRRLVIRGDCLALAAGAALLGALPWIWSNVRSHLGSFRHGPQPSSGNPILDHLKVLAGHALPIALGLRQRISGRWVPDPKLGQGAFALALIGCALFLLDLAFRRKALVLVAFFCTFPVLYVLSPFSWFWADGRYVIFLTPMTSLLVVAGVHRLVGVVPLPAARRGLVAAVLCVAGGLVLTGLTVSRLNPYRDVEAAAVGRTSWSSWHRDPTAYFGGLARILEAHRVDDLYAGYWMAYPITFESRGAVTATDPRYSRYEPYRAAVRRAVRPGWLFVVPDRSRLASVITGSSLMDPGCAAIGDKCLAENEFLSYLRAHRIGFRTFPAEEFEVVVPDRNVPTRPLLQHFRVQP